MAKAPAKSSKPTKAKGKAKAGKEPEEGTVAAVDKKVDRTFRFVTNERVLIGAGAFSGRQHFNRKGVKFIMRITKGTKLPTWADPIEFIPEPLPPVQLRRGPKVLKVVDDDTGEETDLPGLEGGDELAEGEQVSGDEGDGLGNDEAGEPDPLAS